MGYSISFDEKWDQHPAEPSQGYVLSLGYGEDANSSVSADVFVFEWDVGLSVYDLADAVDPSADGTTIQPLETIEIAGESGLLRPYELEVLGNNVIGRQIMVVRGDRAAVIYLEAVEDSYDEFIEEFEAMVSSFNFLP